MLDKVPLTMRRAALADRDDVMGLQAAADADLQVAQSLHSSVYATTCWSLLNANGNFAMHAAECCWLRCSPAAASSSLLCARSSATLSSSMLESSAPSSCCCHITC